MEKQLYRVVIVGGGFGGLRAAKALGSAAVEVKLIDRRNYHLFQPLLYQVATGSLSPGQIAAPLRSVLCRQKNVQVLLGEVVEFDTARRRVLLADGAMVEYDALIVAAGSQTSYYGNGGWREWAPSLKSVEEATRIRHKILFAFEAAERSTDAEERRAWLRFVIVGGGATGVELAGAIAEIARQTLKNDFRVIHPEESEILLLDAAPRILTSFPEDLAKKAARSLLKLGVQIHTGMRVKEIDSEGLILECPDGTQRLLSKTVIWGGGVKAVELARKLAEQTGAETDRGGRIRVEADLTIRGFPEIFVIGDLAAAVDRAGQPLPGVAQVAMQEGAYAAKTIVARVRGKSPPKPFHYRNYGELAVIGRAAAVANIFGLHLSGFIAWLVWLLVHLLHIVQFRSRLTVFIEWAVEYLTFSRGARLITGPAASKSAAGRGVAEDSSGGSASAERKSGDGKSDGRSSAGAGGRIDAGNAAEEGRLP